MTHDELKFYNQNGYLLLGKILDDKQIQELVEEEERMLTFLANKVDLSGKTSFISNVCNYSAKCREFSMSGRHIEKVKSIVGDNLLFWYSQFVVKMPDNNKKSTEFPWHQDNGYGIVSPATNVTVWVALTDTNLNNGCLWILPESHQDGIIPHYRKSAAGFQLVCNHPRENEEIAMPMKAGDAVMFSGLTLHRSKFNSTDKERVGFFMEYSDAAANCQAYNWDTNTYDESLPIINRKYAAMVSGQIALDSNIEYT